MPKKYIPAIFQPTIRPSWGGALHYIKPEEKAAILEALVNYPKETNINSRFWEETIKPDLDSQYENFVSTCSARGRGAKSYWERKGVDKDNLSSPYVKLKDNLLKDEDNNKYNINNNNNNNITKTRKENIKEKNKRYGECQNVILTEEQFNKLSAEHDNLSDAIEKLDTWLGTSGGKNKNKNHYPYFKANSWVWEGLKKNEPSLVDFMETIKIDDNLKFDETMPEFSDMTFEECTRAYEWMQRNMYGKEITKHKFIEIVHKFKNN